MIFFFPTLIQSIERKRKIVVIEYMYLEKKLGFLDNLRKSLVRIDIVSSGIERITNPGFSECLELFQWLLIDFHLIQIFFIFFTSHLPYLNKEMDHNICVDREFGFADKI